MSRVRKSRFRDSTSMAAVMDGSCLMVLEPPSISGKLLQNVTKNQTNLPTPSMITAYYSSDVQGSAIRWALGCVNPASWFPLAVGGKFTQPRVHLLADPCTAKHHERKSAPREGREGERDRHQGDGEDEQQQTAASINPIRPIIDSDRRHRADSVVSGTSMY